MKITTITGVAEMLNIEVQKSISHLVVKKVKNPFNTYGIEKLSARILDSETSKEIEVCKFILISALADINASLPGAVRIMSATDMSDTAIIQLNDEGIRLSGSRKLFVDFTGLDTASSYEVYGIESLTSDDTPFVYEKKVISAGLTDYVAGVKGYGLFAIDVNVGNIDSISLTHENGAVINMNKTEVLLRQLFDNDIVQLYDATTGYSIKLVGTLCVLPLSDITQIRIVSSAGNIEYYLLKMAD